MAEPPRRSSTAAVVLHWNGWDFTRRCLDDLSASRVPVDVIAIDNGSADGGGHLLESRASGRVRVERLHRNIGFAAGMNLGLRTASAHRYEHVWLLNNDVSVPPDTHGALLATLGTMTGEAVLTPVLRTAAGVEQHVGGTCRCDGSAMRLLAADEFGGADQSHAWLTGTALFTRTSTALRVGPFDERLFAYWEDVDWSFRAVRCGVRLAVSREAGITHFGSGGYGSPTAAFLLARNEVRVLRGFAARDDRTRALRYAAARQVRLAMMFERRGQPAIARALLGGLAAGLIGRSGAPRRLALPEPLFRAVMRRPLALARWLERRTDPVRLLGAPNDEA
jgi:GT2 family glycosyltransferase